MRRRDIDMLNGSLASSILRYSIPIMLTNILQMLFHSADLVVVGQYRGSMYVGAVSATGAITNLIINLMIGFSLGIGVTVARGLGSKRDEDVYRAVHTALPTAILGGAIVSLIGVIFAEDFLVMMDTTESILPHAVLYMQINFGGMVFTMIYNFCASILRAAGDTKSPLQFLTISGVVNVILNLIFVLGFGMDVDGVGYATVISKAVSAVLVVLALVKRTDVCHLELRKIRFYKQPLIKLLYVGLPAGIQSSLFAISNVFVQSAINSFHSDALIAGNGAGSSIDGFLSVGLESFQHAALNFTGQNAGAHRFDRIKKTFRICIGYMFLFGLSAGLLIRLFAEPLLSLYINDSPEAIAYGVIRFTYIAIPYFICGMMTVSTGSLRGLGASFIPMAISVLGICGLRVLWIETVFQIPKYHTPECLYMSFIVSWISTFIVQTIVYMIVLKRKEQAYKLCSNRSI